MKLGGRITLGIAAAAVAAGVWAGSAAAQTATSSGVIHGVVWEDTNRNRLQDSGETGLSGFTVRLYTISTTTATSTATSSEYTKRKKHKNHLWHRTVSIATTTTDGSGKYSFGNLLSGFYFVELKKEEGWHSLHKGKRVRLMYATSTAEVNFALFENGYRKDDDDKRERKERKERDKEARKAIKHLWKEEGWHDNGNHYGWFKAFKVFDKFWWH